MENNLVKMNSIQKKLLENDKEISFNENFLLISEFYIKCIQKITFQLYCQYYLSGLSSEETFNNHE